MLSLRIYNVANYKERDNTARQLLNFGRHTGKTKPYIQNTRNLVTTTVLDTEFFESFMRYASAGTELGLTDIEMLLFRIKQSTETTGVEISETEREQVFDEISANVMALVNEQATTDKVITEEWRLDSEKNTY